MLKRTFALAVIALQLSGCDAVAFFGHEEKAVRACEELKGSLTSPSSYQSLWSSFTPAEPVTKNELIEINETRRQQAIKRGDDAEALISFSMNTCLKNPKAKDCDGLRYEDYPDRPRTAFILIQYEAANAFNAKIPGYFLCRANLSEGDEYEGGGMLLASPVPRTTGDQLKAQAELMKKASG